MNSVKKIFWNLVKVMSSIFLMLQTGLLLAFVTLLVLEGPTVFNADLADAAVIILKYSFYYAFCFWIINTNLISVFWTGRTWFIYGLIGGGLVLFGLFIGVAAFLEHASPHFPGSSAKFVFKSLLVYVFLSLSLLILGGTVFAYVTAYRKKLIRVSTCLIAGVLWGIGVSIAYYFLYSPPTGRSPGYFVTLFSQLFFVALGTLLLTPFATIPLALSWNRHR